MNVEDSYNVDGEKVTVNSHEKTKHGIEFVLLHTDSVYRLSVEVGVEAG